MKTGRVRSKEEAPAEEPRSPEAAPPAAEAPAPAPVPQAAVGAAAPRARSPLLWVFLALCAALACGVLLFVLRGAGRADEWVPAARTVGNWTTGLTVFGPQLALQETWQSDCTSRQGTVQTATCVLRDTGRHNDRPVQEYDEYAYNIYWDETWGTPYQAQGTEFRPAMLGGSDRWEGNYHYVAVERLKKDACDLTGYTVWVNDPQDAKQEIEVYLYDCEVWDHVTVTERVYEQAPWCQCQVTTIVMLGQTSSQGTGLDLAWPAAEVPAGGRAERAFSGKVTFSAGNYVITLTTDDPAQYERYLSGQYYIGVKNGRAVQVSDRPPER